MGHAICQCRAHIMIKSSGPLSAALRWEGKAPFLVWHSIFRTANRAPGYSFRFQGQQVFMFGCNKSIIMNASLFTLEARKVGATLVASLKQVCRASWRAFCELNSGFWLHVTLLPLLFPMWRNQTNNAAMHVCMWPLAHSRDTLWHFLMFYDCVCILFFRTTLMKTLNASTHMILIVTLEDR